MNNSRPKSAACMWPHGCSISLGILYHIWQAYTHILVSEHGQYGNKLHLDHQKQGSWCLYCSHREAEDKVGQQGMLSISAFCPLCCVCLGVMISLAFPYPKSPHLKPQIIKRITALYVTRRLFFLFPIFKTVTTGLFSDGVMRVKCEPSKQNC